MNDYLGRRRSAQINNLRDKLKQYFQLNHLNVSRKYPFILADWNDWPNNIIDSRVAKYVKETKADRQKNKKPFPLHKYLHHGLSSQAFLFNLIGPLIVENRFDIFKKILISAGASPSGQVSRVELEVEDREVFAEKSGQPTSVDLVITTNQEEKYYIEFKFTEAEFGGCSLFFNGDCDGANPCSNFQMCILEDIQRKYWPLMKDHGLLTQPVINDSRCPFMDLYQAYRVVMFSLANDGEFILMYDDRNPAFVEKTNAGDRGVYNRFLNYLPSNIKTKCHQITTQEIFEIISSEIKDKWVIKLKEKYFN